MYFVAGINGGGGGGGFKGFKGGAFFMIVGGEAEERLDFSPGIWSSFSADSGAVGAEKFFWFKTNFSPPLSK